MEWASVPHCGAVVTFTGIVRDDNEDLTGRRTGIVGIDYEAFDRHVEPRLRRIARAARGRWPVLGRVALFHRSGPVPVTEASELRQPHGLHSSNARKPARGTPSRDFPGAGMPDCPSRCEGPVVEHEVCDSIPFPCRRASRPDLGIAVAIRYPPSPRGRATNPSSRSPTTGAAPSARDGGCVPCATP
ncbi:molybdenum cofactor biosynthesis protein MoaE [Streptomyces sp. NPDC049541]|uniref:molybdenum cofactor biosynthesis protein MoaE n=1 Tax=Streptomyces sp. NPDC049541 TaxID=3365594 RepID=UPI0037AE692D